MAKTAQQAYDKIVAHIKEQGGPFSKWYCGITSDIEDRLYGDHNVPRVKYWLITIDCANEDDARTVEKALLKLGCDGGSGGGDKDTIWVYAYLKTSITNP